MLKILVSLVSLFVQIQSSSYVYRVVKTPIFHFTRSIKQHHIVVIQYDKTKEEYRPGTFAVDFTPTQQNWKTMVRLFLGMNVPAKIRVRFIIDLVSLYHDSDQEIEEKWMQTSINVDPVQLFSPTLTLTKQSIWADPQTMNLYTHNCQHFSRDLVDVLQSDDDDDSTIDDDKKRLKGFFLYDQEDTQPRKQQQQNVGTRQTKRRKPV